MPAPSAWFLSAADLSKACDKLHGDLAAAAMLRLGRPSRLVQAWKKAWVCQGRFLQFGFQTGTKMVQNICCLPQGEASPMALMAPLKEALSRLKTRFGPRQHGPVLFRFFIDDRIGSRQKPPRARP